jgi:hypothetical protein
MLITKTRLKAGINRLLAAPMDLALSGAPVWDADPKAPGSAQHRALFKLYVKELRKKVPAALRFWEDLASAAKSDGDEMAAWRTRPAGPASDPHFVAVIRNYWLRCHALNMEVEAGERIPPEVFLLAWLVAAEHSNFVEVLACMPYWPIGMDEDGAWC